MSFADTIRTLSTQIKERRKHVSTEEATKQALILPFLAALGYDVYNPAELVPEFRAGWAKSAEKVDYAIQLEGTPVLLVEAKGPFETLSDYDPQLAKYFNSTPSVRFAVITNGVQYRFFTDLQERNILDKRPFFEFDFENLKEEEICVLERFRREVFDLEDLIHYAEDLVYLTSLKGLFKTLIREPSEDLIRLAVRAADLTDTRVNQKVVDRFKPLVKESLSAAILEIVGQSFLSRPEIESAGAGTPDGREVAETSDRSATSHQPTEEELRAFDLVVRSVADQVPEPDKLGYQDRTGYFAILYGNGWFTRLCMQGRKKKHVVLRLPIERVRELAPGYEVEEVNPSFGSCRIVLQSADDLGNLSEVFVHAARDVASGRSRATGTLF